jgi:hypothetical protein
MPAFVPLMTAGEVNLTEYFVDGDREETEIFGGSSIQNRLEISQLAINRRPNRLSLTDRSMRGLITTLNSPVQLDFRHSWQGATREQRVSCSTESRSKYHTLARWNFELTPQTTDFDTLASQMAAEIKIFHPA